MPEQGFQRCAAGRVEKMTIRSKHNDLLNYFIHDERDLIPAYVRSCEKFFKSLKPQAPSTTKKPQLNNRINK
jgi:hypothetical protein